MRTTIATKLCLGLLFLALVLPAQIYSVAGNSTTTDSMNTTVPTTADQSQDNTTTATTGSGNSLQSTGSLFIFSLSLLHLYC